MEGNLGSTRKGQGSENGQEWEKKQFRCAQSRLCQWALVLHLTRTSTRACRCTSCLMDAKLKYLALMPIHDWLQATSVGGHPLVLLACPVHRLRTVLWLEKAGSEGCRNLQKEGIKVTWKGECLQRGCGWGSKSICCIQGAPTPLPPGSCAREIIDPGFTANKVLF